MSEQFTWTPAKRESIKGKFTIEGVSGAGKTTAALLLAYGLCEKWDRILLADTENRRALYTVGQVFDGVSIGDFMHLPVNPPYSPARLTDILHQAENSRLFDVIIFDSFSKEWEGVGGVLEAVEGSSNNANKFTAWKVPGDAHRRFVDAIQHSPLHVICTMRSKTKYDIVDEERNGRTVKAPVKRGLEPIQRAGTEYEFDVGFVIESGSHVVSLSKDNTRVFMSDNPTPITPDHGRRFVAWSNGAASQVGASDWIKLRETQLNAYGGTMEGLISLWKPIFLSFQSGAILEADYIRLVAAKDAAKKRLEAK